VTAAQVDVAIERGRGGMINAERQVRAIAPRGAVKHVDRAQAAAHGVKPAHHVELSARRGRGRLLERHGERRLHSLCGLR
jgi:hypothetical protein